MLRESDSDLLGDRLAAKRLVEAPTRLGHGVLGLCQLLLGRCGNGTDIP